MMGNSVVKQVRRLVATLLMAFALGSVVTACGGGGASGGTSGGSSGGGVSGSAS